MVIEVVAFFNKKIEQHPFALFDFQISFHFFVY